MSEPEDASLPRSVLRAELTSLPGWVTVRSGRALRCAWQFGGKEAASAYSFALLAVCFERSLFGDWSLTGTHVGVLLSDPQSGTVTRRVVDLARRLSELAGPREARHHSPAMKRFRAVALRAAREIAK